MKKFLAILTIVAMLSSMVVIGASADGAYAIDMDFADYAGSTVGAHERTNLNTKANAIAHSSKETGLYANGNGAVSGDAAITAVDGYAQSTAFWIKVSDFFEGKSAGTYTIEFDYISNAAVYAQRLDVGGTLNACQNALWAGSTAWIQNKEGFNQYNLAVFGAASASDWAHASLTFEWDGTNTVPTFEVAGSGNNTMAVADYDVNSLCMKIYASDNSVLKIDNLKVGNVLQDAEVALESTVAPLVVAPVIDEDFTGYAGSTVGVHERTNLNTKANAVAHSNVELGVYGNGNGTVSGNAAITAVDGAAQSSAFWIKVPDFFEGKSAGTYTIEFDYISSAAVYAQRLDVGGTLNACQNALWSGSTAWIQNKEGFNQYNLAVFGAASASDWAHAYLTFDWDGTNTVPTFEVAGTGNNTMAVADYDVNSLCMKIYASDNSLLKIDNLKVYPVGESLTGTVVDYAGKNMTVNNTVYVNNGAPLNAEVISAAYDQNGNLRAVNSAPVAITTEANKAANVTLAIPAGVTTNWTFKSFIWSDLDNEIEPLYDAVNPFDANIKQSIGVEFNPVTEVPSTFDGTFVMAKDWVSTGAYCLSDYAVNGRYSMFIPSGKTAYLADDGFLAKNGEGTYTVRVWFIGTKGSLVTRLHKDGKLHRYGATSGGGGAEPYTGGPTHVLDTDGTTKISKTVNGKTYYLHEVVLDTSKLYGDSSSETQGFKFSAYDSDYWVEVESIVFTPAE